MRMGLFFGFALGSGSLRLPDTEQNPCMSVERIKCYREQPRYTECVD